MREYAGNNSSWAGSSSIWRIWLAVTALKLLLVPTYHSTDLEVHRNWMAITSNIPIIQWYTEDTSMWTLDYPPLFAWFERLLAIPAALYHPAMLHISRLPYESPECILFQNIVQLGGCVCAMQRLSVIISDALLFSAIAFATRKRSHSQQRVIRWLVAANAGLLIVDHIHFQYNGLLIGILVWSIALMHEGRDVAAAFCFAVLLNMKHLFAALAPLYFVYLLSRCCRGPAPLYRFVMLGTTVAAVFSVSLGPFVLMRQMPQLLQRLFPFQRGLLHAYWAPNIWALYAFIDKFLVRVLPAIGFDGRNLRGSMTGGLVQVGHFLVLPDVGAGGAASAVLMSMLPLLISIWRQPDPACFARCVALASLNGFMLGYHVHEKAILLAILSFSLDAAKSPKQACIFHRLSNIGHFSLLPLIFTHEEYPLKMLVLLTYSLASYIMLEQYISGGASGEFRGEMQPVKMQHHLYEGDRSSLLSHAEYAYFGIAALLEGYCTCLHPFVSSTLSFLPLMLTSVTCALGLLWTWSDLWIVCSWHHAPCQEKDSIKESQFENCLE